MPHSRSDYHSAATGGLQALPRRLDRTLLTERKIHGRQHRGETTAHVAPRLAKAYPQRLRRHAATQKSPASDKHRRAVRDQLAAELSATRSTPAPSLCERSDRAPNGPPDPVGIDAGHFLHLVPYSRNYGGVAALPTPAGCWHFPQYGSVRARRSAKGYWSKDGSKLDHNPIQQTYTIKTYELQSITRV